MTTVNVFSPSLEKLKQPTGLFSIIVVLYLDFGMIHEYVMKYLSINVHFPLKKIKKDFL